MNDFYHVCMTAHGEVLLRSEDDARDITNLIALSAFRSGTQILVDAIMSNHMHFIVLSENPARFVLSMRISITKHFNARHRRKGSLFDRKEFISRLEGARHITMAINYVLKNPVHHGQTSTPYSYKYSSANYLFADERGVTAPRLIARHTDDIRFIGSYFPKNAKVPETVAVDGNGMASRLSFEEIRLVESFYFTPNSFIYNMNRKTSDDWIKEQEQDNVKQVPITLELIEKGVKTETLKEMLKNENGLRFSRSVKSDTEVCQLVDNELISKYRAISIYCIDIKQRLQIALTLIKDYHIPMAVAARCSIVQPSELKKALENAIVIK